VSALAHQESRIDGVISATGMHVRAPWLPPQVSETLAVRCVAGSIASVVLPVFVCRLCNPKGSCSISMHAHKRPPPGDALA
jgi:hypothetical protein